jgi:hypothetical protein
MQLAWPHLLLRSSLLIDAMLVSLLKADSKFLLPMLPQAQLVVPHRGEALHTKAYVVPS